MRGGLHLECAAVGSTLLACQWRENESHAGPVIDPANSLAILREFQRMSCTGAIGLIHVLANFPPDDCANDCSKNGCDSAV